MKLTGSSGSALGRLRPLQGLATASPRRPLPWRRCGHAKPPAVAHPAVDGPAAPELPEQLMHLQLASLGSMDALDGSPGPAGDCSYDSDGVAPASAADAGALAGLAAMLPRVDGRVKGLILLNIMTLLMGSNWAVIKESSGAAMTDATVFMALRFGLAALVFAPFLRPDPRIIKAGSKMGAWYAAGYVTQALALARTAASRASLLSTFTVLAVPMIAGLGGQRIRPIVWGCAAAALAGTALLMGGGAEGGGTLGPPNAGDMWAVVSAICFAAQICTAERLINSSDALPPKSELPLMAASMLTVACLTAAAAAAAHAGDAAAAARGLGELFSDWRAALLPAALGGGGHVPAAEAAEAARTAGQLFWTSVVTTDAVLFAELMALQEVSSTDAAMIYSMEPVVGAAIACAMLGERLGPWGIAGGAVILGASLLTQAAGATEKGGGSAAAEGAVAGGGAADKGAE